MCFIILHLGKNLELFEISIDKELKEKIITNTARLAKRQKTFNASQFKEHFKGSVKEIRAFLV